MKAIELSARELRTLSAAELDQKLDELLKEQFVLRMQKSTGQLNRPSQFKAVRRAIARIKTLMTEKSAGGQA